MTNEVLKAMEERRSCRRYKPDPVAPDVLQQVVRAGLFAASGMGKQSAIIVCVTDPALRNRLSAMNAAIGGWDDGFDPFYGAPAVLVVLADKNVPTHVYDGSLVMGNLMLAAHTVGLGSCWIHRAKEEFDSDEGRAILRECGIEGDWEGVGHCVLGYPAAALPQAAPRKENRVFYAK